MLYIAWRLILIQAFYLKVKIWTCKLETFIYLIFISAYRPSRSKCSRYIYYKKANIHKCVDFEKKKKKTPDFTSLYQSYSEFIYIFRNFGANLELKLFVENPWVITFLDIVAHRYKASAFKTENLSYYFGLKRH